MYLFGTVPSYFPAAHQYAVFFLSTGIGSALGIGVRKLYQYISKPDEHELEVLGAAAQKAGALLKKTS